MSFTDGKVGIGTSDGPDVTLHIAVGSDVTPTGGGYLQIGQSSASNIAIDGNEIMARDGGAGAQITVNANGGDVDILPNGSGMVGIGTGTPTEMLHVAGNICSTGTIGVCSDARYKESVEPLNEALSIVRNLRGVSYRWKTDEFPDHAFSDERQVGFVAQELLTAFPEVVSRGSDGYYSVDYGRLTPVLVEAIKEQDVRVGELQQTNDELARRVEALESVVAEMAATNAQLARFAQDRPG